MSAVSGAMGRLVALCALCALTERLTLGPWLRLMCGLMAAEAILDIILSLLAFGNH